MSKENHSVAKSSQQPCLASPTTDPLTVEQRYQRAQSILQGLRTQNLVQNDRLLPHWITGTCCFWYQRHKKLGPPGSQLETEFRLVNTQDLSSKPAFDHRALAESLGRQVGQLLDANSLPIEILSVSVSPLCIRFTAFDQQWQFNGATRDCETMTPQLDALPNSDTQLSPNGKTLAFVREGNIGLKILATGAEYPLTHDGQDGFAYAKKITASGIEMAGVDLQWSPDSRRILTSQRDTRGVRTCPMVDYNPTPEASRATVTAVKVALPGDRDIERHYLLSIDTVTGETTQIDWPGLVAGAEDFGFFLPPAVVLGGPVTVAGPFCVVFTAVDYQCVQLLELDTHTGAARIVFEEPSAPYINLQADYLNPPLHCFLPDSDELIWWSERSGWGHLYRYDLITGECLGAITQGEWQVRNLLQVDCAGASY